MDSKTIVITTTLRNLTLSEGLEPPTSRLTVERANQLRHESKETKLYSYIFGNLFDASQIKSLVQKNCCMVSLWTFLMRYPGIASYGARTRGPRIKSPMLYQLS